MKIKLDGDYGTKEHPDERVTLYCVDAPAPFPVHGRVKSTTGARSWGPHGEYLMRCRGDALDLVPLQAEALTQPSVNWDHIADDWNAMAKDENGRIWFYAEVSGISGDAWNGSRPVSMKALASLDPGTCDWRDSLVRRPT